MLLFNILKESFHADRNIENMIYFEDLSPGFEPRPKITFSEFRVYLFSKFFVEVYL